MPDWVTAARRAAERYEIDPRIFVAQIRAESGGRQGATSSAGAQDIAQFIPSTARQYGVKLGDGRISDDLDGAARYMRDNLKRTGGDYKAALSIYNSGKPDGYKRFDETREYVSKILNTAGGVPAVNPKSGSAPTPGRTVTTTSGPSEAEQRNALLGDYLSQRGRPGALIGLGTGLANIEAPTTTTTRIPGTQAPASGVSGRAIGNTRTGSPVPGQSPRRATHQTAGLAGYPAYDYMAPAGTATVAPVSGTIRRVSGKDPRQGGAPGGALGYSIYLDGADGRRYFLTHLDKVKVKPGDRVKRGQRIAVVANGPPSWSTPHVHMGVNG